MSRGLRQGCPIAPMLYAAWVCQYCHDLDASISKDFTVNHMSVFADDKHFFWEIHSKRQLQQAVRQLQLAIELLEKRCMQVSFSKSHLVYALRGRLAVEMVGRRTAWFRGERCFILRGGHRCVRLPVHDRISYLGVILSYGSFEMQTVQHRVEKAKQNFGMLSKVLRARSALSVAVRLRIYRARVWSTMMYGVSAVGYTAGCIHQLISVASMHLRKVLRIHERGTTHAAVLDAADLDIPQLLLHQSRNLLSSVTDRRDREGGFGTLELQRATDIFHQITTFSQQSSQGTLRAVVADQVPSVPCPVCGIEFSGDYGLQMHIKARHADLNQSSKIDFVRSKHSLFGTPLCRFCHCRFFNWQSLEKHISEGGCAKIKEAFALGQTLEELYESTAKQEADHPPTPPDESLMPVRLMINSGHPVLKCPLHEIFKHGDAFVDIRLQCGLCGQLVREANTMKTHWRISHPKAWGVVRLNAEQEAKSLKACFGTPCNMCGISNKIASQHAARCPVFFQLRALRKLVSIGGDSSAHEGAKQQRPRQHERDPLYKTWSLSTTPLGTAFGLATSCAETKSILGSTAAHPARQTAGTAGSSTTSSQNAPKTKAAHLTATGLHRFFNVRGADGGADNTRTDMGASLGLEM